MSHYKSLSVKDEHELSSSPNLSQGDLNDPWNEELINMNKKRRRRLVWIGVGVLAIVATGVAVALGITLSKKGSSSSGSSSGSGSGSGGGGGGGGGGSTASGTSGKTGSTVKLEDGTTFVYTNDFGASICRSGQAQSWSPRIGSEQWVWGQDVVRGVNLGGWLVTEPFICPALYEAYINKSNIAVVDEWTLSQAMGADLATKMEEHYKSFITEKDFADVAAAGLNWVRIPIGFWAIETINDEPFLVGTSWAYFLKAIQWARKYGIRIYLDLHALPGSQNGWVSFMNGVMGIANAQRTLTYLRIITEFVSQPQYRDVVGVIGIVNEILWGTIGKDSVQSFYLAAYEAIRTSTGVGSGPYIAIHEGFQGPAIWEGFLAGADRLALDQHPYLAFMGDTSPGWAIATNRSQSVFGVTLGGEFSAAINNCGLCSPDCSTWDNWSAYSSDTVAGLKNVALASMDALQNFFFWTWKIGNSTQLGTSSSPMWHYQLGLQQGWIPKIHEKHWALCPSLSSSQVFDGNYPSSATGGVGAGTIDPAQSTSHSFPPATISPPFQEHRLPCCRRTRPRHPEDFVRAHIHSSAPAVVGTGWNNAADNQPAYVPISGCSYPNPWDAVTVPLPATTCSGH
ncbi:glycoside hydrolase superfamily [Flammula alnicola]|nr:glycoside hydrolase superfamily [Flammula alnicola]